MGRHANEERREALFQLVGRPLLLIFWSLVLWGTLYGLILMHAAIREGPRTVLQRVLAGRDLLGGFLNLGLAASAAVVWLGVAIVAWRNRSRGTEDGMRTIGLAASIVLLTLGAFVLIRHATSRETLYVGGAAVVIAVPLLGLARRQLGSAFSIAPRAKGLVTHGLYARMPHPMYVFLDLALLGVVVALRQAWLLVIWVGLVLVQAWQAQREGKVLEQAFGDAYRAYRRRTWW
jgi:protein-S-isoprenylcysteine O-methyltransferase Ste14